MTILTSLKKPIGKRHPVQANVKTNPAEPKKDTFLRQVGSGALNLMKKAGKAAKPYLKSALITAAPAIATAAALAIGGIPLAAGAILASGGIGGVAGAATWGKDIGIIRGFAAGGMAGMISGFLGAVGSGFGALNMAIIGAGREAILRHVADVPKGS